MLIRFYKKSNRLNKLVGRFFRSGGVEELTDTLTLFANFFRNALWEEVYSSQILR